MKGATERGGGIFGDGLAARRVVDYCRRPPRINRSRSFPRPEAVHEVRKALKRWRALLRLLARPLGEQADQMRSEARELMRGIAGARDAQSALDALSDLRKADLPFSPTSVETIRARLTEKRDAAEAKAFTKTMRDRLTRYFDYATLSLERWPLKAIDFDIVTDGLTSTYRRARQLLPDSWSDAEAEHLHDLRRRVVEHRHQMDLVEPLWPRLGKVWAEEAQRLRNRLGSCQDLAVLTELHDAASDARALAIASGAADRGAPRRASENGATSGRAAFCRETESIQAAHRGAVVGAAIKNGRQKLAAVLNRSSCRGEAKRPWQAWQRPTLPSLEA